MTVLLFACMAMLGVAAVLLVVRIALGPTMLDRIVGVDVLVREGYVSAVLPDGVR